MEPNVEVDNVETDNVETDNVKLGDIVLYVLPDGKNKGKVRPAIVVEVWTNQCVNLQVFTDAENDYSNTSSLLWVTSVTYSRDKQPRSWHFRHDA